ncbi:hypothetical protein GGR53DRAFT_530671 [Hypoxylon sp. FL1150]|nr:hypothetical protein GGR53DRAFT_530671 [Hypoxylon sp. FL1150]
MSRLFTSRLGSFLGRPKAPEPPGPAFTVNPTVQYEFDAAQKANYDNWSSKLTVMTMSLQSQMPEVSARALLEFVESPQVSLSFIEFVIDFWHHVPGVRPPGSAEGPVRKVIEMKEFEAAVELFNTSMLSRPKLVPNLPARATWLPRHHIAHFMRSVYKWAMEDVGVLAIRPHLESKWQRTGILVGALMACIRVYDLGSFRAFNDMTGSQYYENHFSPWLSPEYFLWRQRHAPMDPEAHQRTYYLIQQTAQDHVKSVNDGILSNATWFTYFAYYSRNDFAIDDSEYFRWFSDVGFSRLDDIRVLASPPRFMYLRNLLSKGPLRVE